MLMLSLLAEIKVCRKCEGTRAEGETRAKAGYDGLGGNWAADRRHGTSVEQSSLLRLESYHPK